MNIRTSIVVLAAVLGMASVAVAHHSPANFDLTVTDFAVTGKVKSVEFRNPHSEMVLEVADKSGKVAEWNIEFSSVNLLLRRGWKLDRIKYGDAVTCVGNPDKTGANKMYMWSIKLSDGTTYAK